MSHQKLWMNKIRWACDNCSNLKVRRCWSSWISAQGPTRKLELLEDQVSVREKSIKNIFVQGAGKSSIVTALFRLADPTGRIVIDGIDALKMGLQDLRANISIIPQVLTHNFGKLKPLVQGNPVTRVSDIMGWRLDLIYKQTHATRLLLW